MSKSELRAVAIGAIRSIAREFNLILHAVTPDDALQMLDELARNSPELVASTWYKDATDAQIKLFKRDWLNKCKEDAAYEFERLHKEGAKQFGMDWLVMNKCVAEAAQSYGMDVRANRTLLSGIAFRACQTFAQKESKLNAE